MKISYNWLKDYLPINMDHQQVAEILTDIGLEEEGIEKKQSIEGGLDGLVVGEVISCGKHPNADKLSVTSVDIGIGEDLNIVCGAPNVAAGQKVIVATVGTMLYPTKGEPFKLKKGKIRGEVSMGMICAEDEIGLGTDHDGIIVLPKATPVGTPAKEVYQLEDDYVFEIGLTPNRSDATGHIGVAKDLLAALKINYDYDGTFNMPSVADFKINNTSLTIPVEVQDTEGCPRYAGVSIKGITVKESPEWLQTRLKAIGVRPISNIVDITNFILHELGQPLHAFDADEIDGGKVIVKTLPEGTKFVTLDGVERSLKADDLMICDANEKPMCVAGVFGGAKSGVKDTTTNIFLESACFHPIRTRRTSDRYMMDNKRTAAATRFEKGVDPNGQVFALKRAALMIQELAGGEIASEIIDIYPTKVEKAQVKLTYHKLNRLIGITIPPAEVKAIFAALEMDIVTETEDSLTLAVPTNKVDVLREADLIEEVLRIYGYNKVPISPTLHTAISHLEGVDMERVNNATAAYLAANGFNEMMGTSITNSDYYAKDEPGLVRLLNSLNVDYDVMRKYMLFSGLETIEHNQNRKNTDLRLFEFGKTYSTYKKDEANQYAEQAHVTLYMSGNQNTANWQQAAVAVSFFDLKQMVNGLLQRLGITNYSSTEAESEHLSYGLQYKNRKKQLVVFGKVKTTVVRKMGVKQDVYFADFHWDNIKEVLGQQKIGYVPVPKYPSVKRDLALLIDKTITFGEIEQIAAKTVKNLLKSVNLFDIYADESKVGEGKKSYAVSFVLQHDAKTLTDKEIDKLMNKLIRSYQHQLGATLR